MKYKRELAPDDPLHGTLTGYSYGCHSKTCAVDKVWPKGTKPAEKFEGCSQANADYGRRYREANPKVNQDKKEREAARRRGLAAKGLTSSGTPRKRLPPNPHRATFKIEDGSIRVMFECDAPEGAECRLECPDGCESWNVRVHEHELVDGGRCLAVEWLQAGEWSEIHHGEQVLYSGPVVAWFEDDGYVFQIGVTR